MILPYLDDFLKEHPGLQVEFDYSYQIADFSTAKIEGALRYGLSDMPGAHMRLIHRDRVAPVTSPSLVRGIDLPMTSRQIAKLLLAAVEGQERYWSQWFDAAGKIDQRNVKWSTHQHRGLALDFALAGNAVALADIPLIRRELENGSLVCLSETETTLERGIHLAEPLGPFRDARLSAFGDWLTNHIVKMAPSA